MGDNFELGLSLLGALAGWYIPKIVLKVWMKDTILEADEHELIQVVNNGLVVDFLHNKPLVDPPTVPSSLLIATSVWLPLLVAVFIVSRIGKSHCQTTLRPTICAWATAIGTSEGLTQIFKLYVRRRRPNFMELCGYESGECTNSDAMIIEANLSFPSGHSSLSACGMTFLSLTVLSQILLVGAPRRRFWCPLVALTALTYTLFVGTSRIVDHWHFPSDVLAGWGLGVVCSAIVFHAFFPPMWHSRVGIPWAALEKSEKGGPAQSGNSLLLPLGYLASKQESMQE